MLTSSLFNGDPMQTNQKTMAIEVTRPFYAKGQLVAKGSRLTVPYLFARELIANNKAVAAPAEAPAPASEPAPVSAPATETKGKARA